MSGFLALAALAVLGALPWLGGRRPVAPRARVRVPAEAVDPAVLLDLVGAAMAAGASVPAALQALGRAVGAGEVGRALRAAGVALVLGASWPQAWSGAPPDARDVARALEPAWVDGAAPGALVARAAEGIRARRHRQAQEDAARLGVRLVLPLGLCFLPAFVLLGIVPVLLSAGGALLTP